MAQTNPFLQGDGTFLPGSGPVMEWLKEAIAEGEGLIASDPCYATMDRGMEYILGNQAAQKVTAESPAYLPKAVVNESRRTARRHVSALTDIKPVYAFRTANPYFQQQAQLLNQLTAVWWINTFADLTLADAARYAAAAGSGDLVCEYNPYYGPYGDIQLFARDARDTIPIRPSRDGSIQNWFGVILKEAHSVNVLRQMYPNRPDLFQQKSPWGTGVFSKFKQGTSRIMGGGNVPFWDKAPRTGRGAAMDEITLYRAFFNDPSVNTTSHPILMGKFGTSWSYMVQPGDRLYPRKRLIVFTESGIAYDGPSPFWHGLFPVSRLQLEHWPWSFFGLPLIDTRSGLPDAINGLLNNMLTHVQQRANPAKIGNARVPEAQLRQFDPRRPNATLRTNEQIGAGIQAWQTQDLPAWTFELWNRLREVYHEVTGDSQIDALQASALTRIPDADSIEAWQAAMSPELKLEGRQVEFCLREIADMQKANIFQYYDAARRMEILGDAGMTLQDVDYDPGNMIAAMKPGDPGYIPRLDVNQDLRTRAQFMLKLFNFYVTPNSLLALNAKYEQMKYLQLTRMSMCDMWTLGKKLEIPEMGDPPEMMLPATNISADQKAQVMAGAQVPGMQFDPSTGQIMTMRQPQTIPERLMAQTQLGLMLAVGPAGATAGQPGAGPPGSGQPGRKASGQQAPTMERQKTGDGGERVKMTESAK